MYIVLDFFDPDMVNIACDEDGRTLQFETEAEAAEYARDLQDPVIVEVPTGNIVRSNHVLANVVLFPKGEDPNGIPYGTENRIYLNGQCISKWRIEHDHTLESYHDTIEGLKKALPGLEYRDVLFDEPTLRTIFGDRWERYFDGGSLWRKIEEFLRLQING